MKLEPKETHYVSALYLDKIATLLVNTGEFVRASSEIPSPVKNQVLSMLNEILQTRNFVFDIIQVAFFGESYSTELLQLIKTGLSGFSLMLDNMVINANKEFESLIEEGQEQDREKQARLLESLVNAQEILKNILDKLQDVAIIPEVVEEPKQLIVE